ncbi:MAG TPA: hypothetical protein VK640_13085 [Actinomycetes bacterium]|nr:hypothetical protein [Actinomycetes bacterium]
MRRAARRPLAADETVEKAAGPVPESALHRRRATRDADVAGTVSRIDEVTAR